MFVENHQLKILPLQLSHLQQYLQLPLHHRDPFDRLLIAQAQSEGLTLVSQDKNFDLYSHLTFN